MMPRQFREWDMLLLHGKNQSPVVDEDRDPGYQDTAGYEVDKPPEDGECSFAQTSIMSVR